MKGYRWTSPENDQKQRNDKLCDSGLLQIPQAPLYHYTSREVFWKIMDGDSLMARHIMFSNDCHENEIGKCKLIEAVDKVAGNAVAQTDALPFMICFCKNGDLLSQWRGYANEGIALEFDFSKGLYGRGKNFSTNHCYTVMHKEQDKCYLSKIPDHTGKSENIFMGSILSPYAVIYINENGNLDSLVKNFTQKMPYDGFQQIVTSLIPYIKNDKFREEEEYRMIFDMNQLAFGKYQSLLNEKYVYLDVNGVRKPNIRIKFGNQYKAQNESDITVYYVDDNLTEKMKKLKKNCKSEGIAIELVRKVRKYKLNPWEILVSEGKNQERVCVLLRQMLPDKKWKIWCDGHLPIRRIVVGPSKDAEFMKNSIEEYLKVKYWTRDIQVDISSIPLRT